MPNLLYLSVCCTDSLIYCECRLQWIINSIAWRSNNRDPNRIHNTANCAQLTHVRILIEMKLYEMRGPKHVIREIRAILNEIEIELLVR